LEKIRKKGKKETRKVRIKMIDRTNGIKKGDDEEYKEKRNE
jgi:hypothetical protein